MREVTQALLALLESGEVGALATVIKVSGSVPQQPGARLLLGADGRRVGTVGGGAIERVVLEALHEAKLLQASRVLSYDLGRDLGMCCGGSMEIFVEALGAAPRLWLFGAGHIAQPTAALARSVGFEPCIVDEREEWNTAERFPSCRRELTDGPSLLPRGEYGERDWFVIVTHDHRLDEETLRAALRRSPRYIGLVGSRRKVYRLLQRIVARSGSVDLTRVYAPVGLSLGAVGPQEIAVSIVSELIALRRGAESRSHSRVAGDARLARLLAEVTGEHGRLETSPPEPAEPETSSAGRRGEER